MDGLGYGEVWTLCSSESPKRGRRGAPLENSTLKDIHNKLSITKFIIGLRADSTRLNVYIPGKENICVLFFN